MRLVELSQGVWSGIGAGARALRFDAQHQVLGEVSGHRAVEFSCENQGDQPIRLIRSWASCGCIQVSLPAGPIAPGERGKVVLHVDTAEQLPGPMWMLAKVYTDQDPKRPYLLAAEGAVR